MPQQMRRPMGGLGRRYGRSRHRRPRHPRGFCRDKRRYRARTQEIVGIQEHQPVAVGRATPVLRAAETPSPGYRAAGLRGHRMLGDRARIVAGTIIHNDDSITRCLASTLSIASLRKAPAYLAGITTETGIESDTFCERIPAPGGSRNRF